MLCRCNTCGFIQTATDLSFTGSQKVTFDYEEKKMTTQHTRSWPDLAIGLYERLSGSNAEITYNFDKMHVQVPSGTGPEAEHAEWVINGALKISTDEKPTAPKS